MKPRAGSTAAIRSTAWRCRRKSSPGSAVTWKRTIGPSRRSASSRAPSSIRRIGPSDGRRFPPPLVASQARERRREAGGKARGEERGGSAAARAAAGRQADARVGLQPVHAAHGRGLAAPRGAEEAIQRSALQHSRSVRSLFGRLDRRRADPTRDAGDPQSGEDAAVRQAVRGAEAGAGRGGSEGRREARREGRREDRKENRKGG